MCERSMNLVDKKNTQEDEEFDNFMGKVNEVKKLMEGLRSTDKKVADEAMKLADNFLGNPDNVPEVIDNVQLKIKTCKTVINQKAFDEMKTDVQQTQTPAAFMKSCEADAKRRTEERRLQKESSDTLKKQAITAFNKGEFEKALSFYNKAINKYRNSANLYTSRALTCLKLKLYQRTIEDCDLVLRCFDEKSLKALLYKAKALKALGDLEESLKFVEEAIKHHPKCKDEICEYIEKNE